MSIQRLEVKLDEAESTVLSLHVTIEELGGALPVDQTRRYRRALDDLRWSMLVLREKLRRQEGSRFSIPTTVRGIRP